MWTSGFCSWTMRFMSRFRRVPCRSMSGGGAHRVLAVLGMLVLVLARSVETDAQNPVMATCETLLSTFASALPKVSNPAFQRKAWDIGCEHAAAAQADVATCLTACTTSAGCCQLDNEHTLKCYSNSCSGGGCCAASMSAVVPVLVPKKFVRLLVAPVSAFAAALRSYGRPCI